MSWCMRRCADMFLRHNIFRIIYMSDKNKQIWNNCFLSIICLLLYTLVNNLFIFYNVFITSVYILVIDAPEYCIWLKEQWTYWNLLYSYGYTWIMRIIMIKYNMKYLWIWCYIDNTCDMYSVNIVYSGEYIVYSWYYTRKHLRL